MRLPEAEFQKSMQTRMFSGAICYNSSNNNLNDSSNSTHKNINDSNNSNNNKHNSDSVCNDSSTNSTNKYDIVQ